jgi:hypothetical protein
MINALRNSLLWRFLLWLDAVWQASGLRRLSARIGKSYRLSTSRRTVDKALGAPASTTENAKITGLLTRWNARWWRFGKRLIPVLQESLLYRIYHAVFHCGRESKLLGWLFRGGLTAFILVVLGLYSLVDFALRDVLSIPVLSSVWDECLLLLAVLWIVYDRMRAPRPMSSRANPLDTSVFLFMGVGLGLMFAVSPFFSVSVAGYRATVQYMLWFFVLTRLIRDDRDFMTLYMVLVMAAFLIALHGIYQYIVAVPIPSNWTDQAEDSVRTRVFSIFGSPNIMGDFMVMFAPMAAGLAYWFKDKRAKLFFWFVTFCMCFACLFTMSRGAWAAMALTIFVFAILVDRRLIVLMLVAAVCSLFLPFVASRLGYLLSPEYVASTNNGGRGSRWDLALSYLAMNPVLGFGLGMFGGAVAMQNQIYGWISYFYVDNYYLKILVEMGYVGFIAFLILLIALLWTGLRAVYRSGREPKSTNMHPLCAGMFSGLCGVLLHCYSENIFEEPYMMAYFWSIAAMIVYLGFFREKRRAIK